MNKTNQGNCVEEKPWLCFHCQLAVDGMNKYGFQNQMVTFQKLFDKIISSIKLHQNQKDDSIEIISTLVKMLGHSGKVDKVVLKTFNNQLCQLFKEDSTILKFWDPLKSEIMIQNNV